MNGTIKMDRSKNALLPIIAATILTEGVTILKNVPRISDIDNLLKILISMNIRPSYKNGDLYIDTRDIEYNTVNPEIAGKIRGSIFVLGAILGRFGRATVPYPGGCAIGSRPIDLHLQGLRDLGVNVTERNELIECTDKSTARDRVVYLDFPSVGATENLIMASVRGRSRVKITGCAREPEVEDLCNFLVACGAKICGIGTDTIIIHGVKSLSAVTYTAIPDRINTGSYLIAVAACGGSVTITDAEPKHNANLISKLKKMGCEITTTADTISITAVRRPRALGTVHTAPYTGFPTDLQSQLCALCAVSRGVTAVTENLFENRFKFVPELTKLGARFCVGTKSVTVSGVRALNASFDEDAPVNLYAADLRGGVAIVIAALTANGKSVVHNAEYIYRGHAAIERDLAGLGANIIRIDE